ncbi:MAG: methyltransferase domain-containing protein [Legionellaceae bacterium]|nr:methyltransferase domain-containing protein [Legionellaceae bacterium]
MNLDEQRHKYRALNDWFGTPQGHHLGEAFHMQLTRHDDFLRGETLLQLGACGDNLWLDALLFHQKYTFTPCLDTPETSFVGSPQALPFHRNSLDTIIAPMTHEIFGSDKQPLDEIDRVLKPMGYVIFLGINPLSLWGLARRFHRLPCFGQAAVTLTSSLLLRRTLLARGYQQAAFESFYYVPPFQTKSWIKKSLFLNDMGKLASFFPAGFYYLVMQKYQSTLSPVREASENIFLLPS